MYAVDKFIRAGRAPEGYEPSPTPTPAWTDWIQLLDSSVVDLGQPVIERSTVGNYGAGTVLRGYSLIATESREAALTLANECPLLAAGGGVEVGQLGPGPKQHQVAVGDRVFGFSADGEGAQLMKQHCEV